MTDRVNVAERLRWLTRTMATWVLAIVLLVVAGLVGIAWTLGLFTASSANPRNVASAGSMSQVNSADDAAIMAAHDMVPGDEVVGTVSIRNVGDAPGTFTVRVDDVEDVPGPGGGALSERLRLRVVDAATGDPVYVGSLGAASAPLGTWEPDESRTYEFEVELPDGTSATDNTYQGSSVTATFVWDAVQAR